ncbi:MAG: TRAP transporter small permease [Rhodobacteraceae bacterium]|nr:TRAP transporter small permease [Paracoccaceae bacterium]
MRDLVLRLSRALDWLSRLSLWLSGLGLVLMTAAVSWQVWGRFVLNDSPTWTSNGSVLIMSWFILLGAAVGIREGNHLSFDVLLYFMGPRGKTVLHSISDLFVASFGFGMILYGWRLAANNWTTTIPNIGISGSWTYAALIWGGVLMLIFSAERLLRRATGLKTARFGETDAIED